MARRCGSDRCAVVRHRVDHALLREEGGLMNQREITDDLIELLKDGMLAGGRQVQIDRVAGNGNQFAILEEDGSGAIVTVRGPMSSAMISGGSRSFAARDVGPDPGIGEASLQGSRRMNHEDSHHDHVCEADWKLDCACRHGYLKPVDSEG